MIHLTSSSQATKLIVVEMELLSMRLTLSLSLIPGWQSTTVSGRARPTQGRGGVGLASPVYRSVEHWHKNRREPEDQEEEKPVRRPECSFHYLAFWFGGSVEIVQLETVKPI
jgi:hypothetical protein